MQDYFCQCPRWGAAINCVVEESQKHPRGLFGILPKAILDSILQQCSWVDWYETPKESRGKHGENWMNWLSVEKRSPHLWPPQSHRGGYNPPQWGISWRCTLNVVPTTGTKFTVIAESSSTIEEVMVTIQTQHNIPPGHRLLFAGRLLMMDKTLADYNGIQEETTVYIMG